MRKSRREKLKTTETWNLSGFLSAEAQYTLRLQQFSKQPVALTGALLSVNPSRCLGMAEKEGFEPSLELPPLTV